MMAPGGEFRGGRHRNTAVSLVLPGFVRRFGEFKRHRLGPASKSYKPPCRSGRRSVTTPDHSATSRRPAISRLSIFPRCVLTMRRGPLWAVSPYRNQRLRVPRHQVTDLMRDSSPSAFVRWIAVRSSSLTNLLASSCLFVSDTPGSGYHGQSLP